MPLRLWQAISTSYAVPDDFDEASCLAEYAAEFSSVEQRRSASFALSYSIALPLFSTKMLQAIR